MASLITDYLGWEYYDNGTAISPDGTYYFEGNAVWSPEMTTAPASAGDMINGSMGGLSSLFGSLATVAVDTWSKKTLMQTARDGNRYVEGRPVMYQPGQAGGIPPLFLLIGAGALFFALVKD